MKQFSTFLMMMLLISFGIEIHAQTVTGRSPSFILDTRDVSAGPLQWEVTHNSPNARVRNNRPLSNPYLPPARICADGSRTTTFWITPVGNDLNHSNYSMSLAGVAIGSSTTTHGSFAPGSAISRPDGNVYIGFHYTHPEHFGSVGLKRDEAVVVRHHGSTVLEIPIEIYRAPVLMLHGLWGKKSGFHEMHVLLMMGPEYSNWPAFTSREGLYWPGEIRRRSLSHMMEPGGMRIDSSPLIYAHSYNNEASFQNNQLAASNGANSLLQRAVQAGYSAGRVDVVAHSMGGVLTRLEIQERGRNNTPVRSLLTLNTPHWGSQFANWLQGGTPGASVLDEAGGVFLGRIFDAVGSFSSGGVRDLRVVRSGPYSSDETDVTAMLERLISEAGVPMHFVASRDANSTSTGRAARFLLSGAAGADGYTADFLGIPMYGSSQAMLAAIFEGRENDQIVAFESQLGGLSSSGSSVRVFDQLHHVGIHSQNVVIEHVFDLLQVPRANSQWGASVQTRPSSFGYSYSPLGVVKSKEDLILGNLEIAFPDGEVSVTAGSSIRIAISSSDDFSTARLTVFQGESDEEFLVDLPGEVTVEVDEDAVGDLILIADTPLDNGLIGFATAIMPIIPASDTVALDTGLGGEQFVLSGSELLYNARLLYEAGGWVWLVAEDGVEIVLGDPMLADVSDLGVIRGLVPGETTLTIRHGQFEETIWLTVLPADAWDPIVSDSWMVR